jgi:glutathione S-transferase
VICAYLERAHPKPALYPSDPAAYGRALFAEEFSDTRLSEAVGGVFFQRVVRPAFFKQEPDEAAVSKTLAEVVPPTFDWLESQVEQGVLGGALSIADIAVGAQLANFKLGGEKIDSARWPKLAAWAERIHARPSFAKLIAQGAFPT